MNGVNMTCVCKANLVIKVLQVYLPFTMYHKWHTDQWSSVMVILDTCTIRSGVLVCYLQSFVSILSSVFKLETPFDKCIIFDHLYHHICFSFVVVHLSFGISLAASEEWRVTFSSWWYEDPTGYDEPACQILGRKQKCLTHYNTENKSQKGSGSSKD